MKARRRSGATATEFALLLPVLVTIMVGSVDFGRFCYSDILVANAARSGAAYASFNPFDTNTKTIWQDGVVQAVNDEMNQWSGFNAANLTVNVSTVTESSGLKRATVQVTYPFSTLISWALIPSSMSLQHSVTMRMIR